MVYGNSVLKNADCWAVIASASGGCNAACPSVMTMSAAPRGSCCISNSSSSPPKDEPGHLSGEASMFCDNVSARAGALGDALAGIMTSSCTVSFGVSS